MISTVLTVIVWILLAAVFLLALASLIFVISAGAASTAQRLRNRIRRISNAADE